MNIGKIAFHADVVRVLKRFSAAVICVVLLLGYNQAAASWADDLAPYKSLSPGNDETPKQEVARNQGGVQGAGPWQTQEWLSAQADERFTIQLMVGGDLERIKAFVEQRGLAGPLMAIQSGGDNGPRYTLIQGSYTSYAEALNASRTLPIEKPWVRRFADVRPKRGSSASASGQPDEADAQLIKLHDTGWIWARNPQHYTIQLKLAATEQALVQFVARHALSEPLAVVISRLSGKTVYILIQGDYTEYAEADAARKSLPGAVVAAKPWIRPYAAVQDELSRNLNLSK